MLGTEKIEAILDDVKELVIAAKKIKADGKVDLADLPHVISIIPKLGKFIEDFMELWKRKREMKLESIAVWFSSFFDVAFS